MGIDSEAQMHRKFLEMIKLLNIYLNHFPSHEKYGLCQRIRENVYEAYDHMIDAQTMYHKKTALSNLNKYHQRVRMNLLLAFSLGYFGFKSGKRGDRPEETAEHRFLAISRMVDELGRMIGGWIASVRLKQQETS